MSDILVQDNFLDKDYFKKLQSQIFHRDFPWYIQPINNNLSKNDYQLIHGVCNTSNGHHTIYSSLYDNLDQLFKQMNLFTCIRLKINLLKREDKILEHGMHVDFKDDVPKGSLTSILYMNTNNGYTKFETGEKVQSVENRLVTFSNHVQHTGSTNNCDTVHRCVMNINWIKKLNNGETI